MRKVNFDNFGGLTSVLKLHILLIFNCEELVRIRDICERLVRFFSDVKNWYSIFTNVKNRYQFFTPVKNWGSILCREHILALQVLSFLLGLAISDIKSCLGHLAVIFLKRSNNLNIGRGSPTDHLCLILLKSDQKFLTRFKSVSFWLTRQPHFYLKLKSLKKFEMGSINPVKMDEIPPSGLGGSYY